MTSPSDRAFQVELEFRVHTYDIDFAGIVSNIVYLRWLEDLRLALLDATLPLDRQIDQGYLPVLLSTAIAYKRAIRLSDGSAAGRMWVVQLERARCRLEAEILVKGRAAATAIQSIAFVSAATLRPRAIPREFVELFAGQDVLNDGSSDQGA